MNINEQIEKLYNCAYSEIENNREFLFEKSGGEVIYKLNEKIPDDSKYFAFAESVQDMQQDFLR